jgi:hypothetical protein
MKKLTKWSKKPFTKLPVVVSNVEKNSLSQEYISIGANTQSKLHSTEEVIDLGVVETKKRTILKTISWRILAILNSFLILTLNLSDGNLSNALYMNITGFVIYYGFERSWGNINYGRKINYEKSNQMD